MPAIQNIHDTVYPLHCHLKRLLSSNTPASFPVLLAVCSWLDSVFWFKLFGPAVQIGQTVPSRVPANKPRKRRNVPVQAATASEPVWTETVQQQVKTHKQLKTYLLHNSTSLLCHCCCFDVCDELPRCLTSYPAALSAQIPIAHILACKTNNTHPS